MLSNVLWFSVIFFAFLTVIRFILRSFLYGRVDRNNEISVKGKIVVITGANTGIGKATAFEMAVRDANVIMACRNMKAAKEAMDEIRSNTSRGQMIPMELDLASLDSIRVFANEFKSKYEKVDILINNAGVLMPVEKKMKTNDGFEIHFGVNHLGHFLLTNLLLDHIKKSPHSRIINVSSLIHSQGRMDFDDIMSESKTLKETLFVNPLYANSKLANALFNKELSKRLENTGVRTYGLCPGVVFTDMGRNLKIPSLMHLLRPIFWYLLKTPSEGCMTTIYCALSKNCTLQSGEMYQNCGYWNEKDRIRLSNEDASTLWTISEKLVGISK